VTEFWRPKSRNLVSELSTGFWQEGAVSIVLLPSGAQGASLFGLARAWTANGLLSPALWVLPEAISSENGAPPSIRARIVGQDRLRETIEREVDLFEILAREPLRLVRLLKIRSATPSRELDAVQDDIAKLVSDYVGYSMPFTNPSESASVGRVELVRASVICAPTNFQLAERVEWAANDATVTLVASPEDRATPSAGDAFVRENHRFPGFVLMHIATAAGLWSGLPVGSIELIDREASSPHSIYIPRVFVSGVMTDGLARKMAARVLDSVSNADHGVLDSGVGIPAEGTSIIPVSQVDRYVGAMVRAAMSLDDDGLKFTDSLRALAPEQERIGIFRQLALFFVFGAGKIRRIPHWIAMAFRRKSSKVVNDQLQGADGRRIVGIAVAEQLDGRDLALVNRLDSLKREQERVAGASGQAGRVSMEYSTPRLWTGLRHLVFGSLDGSTDLTDFGFAPVEDKQPVFGRVSDVVLNPDDVWIYPGEAPKGVPAQVSWLTIRQNRDLRAVLLEQSSVAFADVDKLNEKFESKQSQAISLEQQLESVEASLLARGVLKYNKAGALYVAKKSSKTATAAEPEGEDATPDSVDSELEAFSQFPLRLKALAKEMVSTKSTLDLAQAHADRLEEILVSFDEWVSKNQKSFVWKLMDEMANAERAADASLEIADHRAESIAVPEPGILITLRKQFNRALLVCWPIIVLIAAFMVYLPTQSEMLRKNQDYPNDLTIILVGVGLLIVTAILFLIPYYRGWSRFERRVALSFAEIDQLTDARRLLASERARLLLVHEQATDWLHLLATTLHQPFKIRPSLTETGLSNMDVGSLPFAMRIARVSVTDSSSSSRLEQAATEGFVKFGWRAEAFGELLNEIGEVVGLDQRRFGPDTLDNDIPNASNNSRALLRNHMRSEPVLERVGSKRLQALVESLQSGALYDANAPIETLGEDPLADFRFAGATIDGAVQATTWIDFLTSSLGAGTTPLSSLGITSHEIQDGYHQEVHTYMLAPERIATDLSLRSDEGTTVRSYHDTQSKIFDVVVRVDMAGPVPVSAIRLWNNPLQHVPSAPTQPTSGRSGI
jgi:hypothetical protein